MAPTAAFAQADTTIEQPTDTEQPPITLADGKTLSECVSALPKPGCRTSDKADPKQLALLGILVAAMAFFGWKISRGVRSRNRQYMP